MSDEKPEEKQSYIREFFKDPQNLKSVISIVVVFVLIALAYNVGTLSASQIYTYCNSKGVELASYGYSGAIPPP